MSFNVQDIVSSINKSGIAQSSHFTVQLTGPSMRGAQELMTRADSVNLPGRTITTAEHKFTNYGPINKVPYGQIYGDSTITFLLSEDLREKDFFEHWQEQMINTGAYEENLASVSPESKWNVKYFHDYIGTVTIRQYGAAGNLKTIHKLQEAYPILIGDVSMAWGNSDAAKLSITFAYKNYTYVTEDNSNQPGLGTGFSFNLGKDGLAGALRVPGFGNISSMEGLGTVLSNDFLGNAISKGTELLGQGIDGVSDFFGAEAPTTGGDGRSKKIASVVDRSVSSGDHLRLPASGNATENPAGYTNEMDAYVRNNSFSNMKDVYAEKQRRLEKRKKEFFK